MRKSVIAAAAVGAAAIGGAVVYYLREKATPGPEYRVVRSEGDLEIRQYPAIIVAETSVSGERKQALGDGFRTLADYIFAKSRPGEELPMTVPVLQETVETGGPDAGGDGPWRVRFVMPTGRTVADLPPPPVGVRLIEVPARSMASAAFSGVADDDKLAGAEDDLRAWLQANGRTPTGEPEYAFYNSPMIPPPLRRNEVLLPL